jgi:hypothetical protein
MWWEFRNACLIVLAGFIALIMMGSWYALFAIPILLIAWDAFCIIRLILLCRRGAHKSGAPEWDRESFGFALGGLISSCVLLLFLMLAMTLVRVESPASHRQRVGYSDPHVGNSTTPERSKHHNHPVFNEGTRRAP